MAGAYVPKVSWLCAAAGLKAILPVPPPPPSPIKEASQWLDDFVPLVEGRYQPTSVQVARVSQTYQLLAFA